MPSEEKIWVRVNGKHVENHALDAKKLAVIVNSLQGLIYELKERGDSLKDYKLYLQNIKPGSSVIGFSNPKYNIHKAYGVINKFTMGISNAQSCDDIDNHIKQIGKAGKAPSIVNHIAKLWSDEDDTISIYFGEEPPEDKKEYIPLDKSKRKLIDELYKKYHEPMITTKHGILIALDSDLKKFGLKTPSGKIYGKYNNLPTYLKNDIKNYFDKPVKIHGEYDEVKKEFVSIDSISLSDEVTMEIFGRCNPNSNLKKVITKFMNLMDNLINSKTTLDEYFNISKVDALKEVLDELEDAVEFRYFQETREDMLWDYTDTLGLFLMKYDARKTPNALLEMKEIFNDIIYDILLPIPDKIEKNQCEDYNLDSYKSLISTYKTKLRNKLAEIESKYEDILPTYEELKKRVETIKLDKYLKIELGKIIKGED